MLKKLFSMMAIVAMVVTFTACGSDNDPDPTPSVDTSYHYSKLTSGSDYTTTTEKYYKFKVETGGDSASISICNVQFVSAAPVLKEVVIGLNKKDITVTSSGFTFSASSIIPGYVAGTTIVPMTSRPMTNVKGSVDYTKKTFSIEFNCYGLDYKDSGTLYN